FFGRDRGRLGAYPSPPVPRPPATADKKDRSRRLTFAPQLDCLTADQRWGSYAVPRRPSNRKIWNGKAKPRTQCHVLHGARFMARKIYGTSLDGPYSDTDTATVA